MLGDIWGAMIHVGEWWPPLFFLVCAPENTFRGGFLSRPFLEGARPEQIVNVFFPQKQVEWAVDPAETTVHRNLEFWTSSMFKTAV